MAREKMAVDKSFRRCMRYVSKCRRQRLAKWLKKLSHKAQRRNRKRGLNGRRGSGWDVI